MIENPRAIVGAFAASVVLNGAAFFSVGHVFSPEAHLWFAPAAKLSAKKEPVTFEFVEAPPERVREKPKKSRRISDRDALARDRSDKSKTDGLTRVAKTGFSDQLAQSRGVSQYAPTMKPTFPSSRNVGAIHESPLRQKDAEIDVAAPDKINAQELGKTKAFGASLYGMTSFEATGSGMGQYMKNVKEKVWLAWFPLIVAKYPQDFKGADAVVHFTLDAEGRLRIVRLVKSDGDPLFASFCIEALQRASEGFGKLPREILDLVGKDELEIRFTFHYR